MSSDIALHRVVLRADQALHLGEGRGSGFSRVTRHHVPGATLRGALCALWWREHPSADQGDFDALIAAVSFSDAVPSRSAASMRPAAVALDRRLCKRPVVGCPGGGHPWHTKQCPTCAGPTEPSKGERDVRSAAEVITATRVGLTASEQAEDKHLYERQGLLLDEGAHLVAMAAGDVGSLVSAGQVLRLGAASSVAGRATVTEVAAQPTPEVSLAAGAHALRLELLTPGVYVDDFGFAVDRPTCDDIRWAFGLADDTRVAIDRAFTRWTTASGWHSMANRPKPEDAAVIAHSCFHLTLEVTHDLIVPALVHDLGIRTTESCGWALLERLPADLEPQSVEGGHDA